MCLRLLTLHGRMMSCVCAHSPFSMCTIFQHPFHFESGPKTCNMRACSPRDDLLGRVTVELHAFILHPDSQLITQHHMLTTKNTVAHEVNRVNRWLVLCEYVRKTLCVEMLNNCPHTDVWCFLMQHVIRSKIWFHLMISLTFCD